MVSSTHCLRGRHRGQGIQKYIKTQAPRLHSVGRWLAKLVSSRDRFIPRGHREEIRDSNSL
ncbi:uncharacterized protein LACBIDRAFT_296343 [Laccaria bicolor S238N-H82]|uniref:Predicted protein n=1 Tax=Laccaria bicolor (strain S238N-H82 / ATCC MYA-4686) TaxID=486041 RepID=B0D8J5_LACBS|nr:uncharacterized protein LACBIDRAFT_296343 [Laccaria bicolor S238N-H82]EDR08852.1 predicted protein [Laccaria bicolor S238N-H82]|eukprot:XP_001880165.1 predicted protein [Laccaria bicolor S238N-H82]